MNTADLPAEPTALCLAVPRPAGATRLMRRRPALMSMDAARYLLGLRTAEMVERIESGVLRWAFDVRSPGAAAASWRLWAREVVAPDLPCDLPSATVVSAILGTGRPWMRCAEVCDLLWCSPQHLTRLWEADELAGEIRVHTLWLDRLKIEDFLLRRLGGYRA
ncbi:MAG: hypothetical protein FJ387_02495 [Verrucomicrobia bacterium]|nr:hypothetical protein [Verrucomicrobiota bacterium]